MEELPPSLSKKKLFVIQCTELVKVYYEVTMKKILITIIIACMVLVTGCSGEPDTKADEGSATDAAQKDSTPGGAKSFFDRIDPTKYGENRSVLYDTEAEVPSPDDAQIIKDRIYQGISTFGAAKIRSVFYQMIEFQKTWMNRYDTEGNLVDDPYIQEVAGYEDMINNLESIKEYISDDAVKEDITSIQSLIAYSVNVETIHGLFFAHHIFSDMNYWGFSYGLDAWEMPVEVYELERYYGISKTWGNEYPDVVKKMLEDPNSKYVITKDLFPFKDHVEAMDAEIASVVQGVGEDNIENIVYTLTMISRGTLGLVADSMSPDGEDTTIEKTPDELIAMVDECISLSAGTSVEMDMQTIKNFIQWYKKTPDSDDTSKTRLKAQSMYFASRLAKDLFQVVFDNDNASGYNRIYFGMSRMLEGETVQTMSYEYLTGQLSTMPILDAEDIDFFNLQ